MDAQALWCSYAGEIASDLSRFHHRRIGEWHRGEMSSQELLELLEFMDDDSAFCTALRAGEPSRYRKAVFQIANELAILRAVHAPGVDGDQWDSQLFFGPTKLREMSETAELRAGAREAIMSIGARND